jgi:hypothetical protein
MTSQQVFLFSIIVALFCICVNKIQTVKILVNYAILVESVEHENPLFRANFLGQIRMTRSEIIYPTLLATYPILDPVGNCI